MRAASQPCSCLRRVPRSIGHALLLAVLLAASLAGGGFGGERMAVASPATLASCPITPPNGLQPPSSGNAFGAGHGDYGNAWLWTSLWVWGDGVVHVDVEHRNAAGEAVDLKWPWYRFAPGTLTIDGHRLDGDAPPLRADVPDGYGESGFIATGLTFPTAGCWEVTGHLGEAALTFVVAVEYLDAGKPLATIPPSAPSACPITRPNGVRPPGERANPGDYGNDALWTNLTMWSDQPGIVNVPDDSRISADGTVNEMKWAWWRFAPGVLTIQGWRLDGRSEPLRADIPNGYGTGIGFQVSGLTFPSAGCWEVVGSVGNAQLAFIVEVVLPPSRAATPASD